MNRLLKHLILVVVASFFCASLQAQTVVRGPYLQLQTADGMTIHWRTDVATDSVVRFGTSSGNLNNTVTVNGSTTEHAVRLSGLNPAQQYYYSVGDSIATLAGDASYHFYTAPVSGAAADTRIWVIGDSGTANSNARAVRDAFKAWSASDPADFWLMLGDNAYDNGTDAEFQAAVFNTYPELLRQLPLWATLGNHDGHSADSGTQSGPYYDIFNLPKDAEAGGLASFTEAYYSFDYANIHFICLDSYDSSRAVNGSMLQWLESDLALNTQPWVIAFWHHPPYTKGSHNSDTEGQLIDMRQNALPILEAWGVDLIMTGHSHTYERSYLIDGHYGSSGTLDPVNNVLNPGDGSVSGDGAYEKPDIIAAQNAGAVYAVAGSSGKVSLGYPLNHPAMFISLESLGSMVLDVSGNRLDAVFLDQTGSVRDEFTLLKTPDIDPPLISGAAAEDASHVRVDFNEAVNASDATNTANYTIAGLSISQAQLLSGDRSVRLTTSAMTSGSSYTLQVSNVRDLVGNTILPNSSANFDFFNVMTQAFQDGVLPNPGYDGTRDAYIRQASATTAHGLETTLQMDGDEPSGAGTDMSIVAAWDLSSIPLDAIVEAAHLEFTVTNISNGVYNCYSLERAWVEAQVTWNQAANGSPWGTAGANAASDRGGSVLCTVNASSTGLLSVSLTAAGLAQVQDWVNNPGGNYGLIIAHPTTSDGADFHSRESSTTTARPKLEVTYRIADPEVNIDPVADFTYSCTDLVCDFTDASSDSDGSLASWAWDFGDGATSTAQHPSHSYAAGGNYTVSLTVTDNDSGTDATSNGITVSVAPTSIDQFAQADLPVAGQITASYVATQSDDNNSQEIREIESGGKKSQRYSYLEHVWQFTVAPGSSVTLFANAWSSGSSDGDTFVLAWSSNSSTFNNLFTVSSTSSGNVQSASIPASGTIYIRVKDTNQAQGNNSLDSIFVDQLMIRTGDATPVDPPTAPVALGVASTSSQSISLVWQHPEPDESGFELQRSPSGSGSWVQVAEPAAGSSSYTDNGLNPGTSYFYRLRAVNFGGESAWSNIANGTTASAPAISLSAQGQVNKGKHEVTLQWSGASGSLIDVVRDGSVVATTANDGNHIDKTGNRGSQTYVYKVCEAGSSICSPDVVVGF